MSNWLHDETLLATFRSEVSERIASLQSGLLQLESSPNDIEVINAIFRDAHTVKGSAKMMGFTAIKELAHRMEDVLGDVKEGRLALGPQLTDVLLQSSDTILRLLDRLDAPDEIPPEVTHLISALEDARFRAGSARKPQKVPSEQRSPEAPTAAGVGEEIPSGGRLGPAVPSESPEAGGIDAGLESAEVAPPRSQDAQAQPVGTAGSQGDGRQLPRVETMGAARVAKRVGTKQPRGSVSETTEASGTLGQAVAMPERMPAPAGPSGPGAETVSAVSRVGEEVPRAEPFVNPIGQSIRIEASKVYELIDQAGEAVIGEVRLEEVSRKLTELSRDTEARLRRLRHRVTEVPSDGHLELLDELRQRLSVLVAQLTETVLSQTRALDRLQEQAMGLAMLPTATIFSPFPRLVRNLSRELGKEVELILDGGGTELDKQVLEQIVDPIRHLLINAVDHGIEHPDERERMGKPRRGTVKVIARHRGRQVVIEVSDDGKGIDPEKVRSAALKKGLVEANDELSTQEILSLLFRPGFSTASLITDTSGRGVGLDVVKEAVDRLKGTVEVTSVVGRGTTFTITLPITLAIVDVLLVLAGEQDFAIPVASVEEVLVPADHEVQEIAGRRCIVWREQAIALFDMTELLGIEAANPEEDAPILVLSSGTRRVAVRVDALLGQQEIVIKGLGSFLPRVRHIAGCSILGDGRVVLVLDPNELVDSARRPSRGPTRAPMKRHQLTRAIEERPKRRLLVVDDSLAIREMLRSIFEAAGYEVVLAPDGEAALQLIKTSKVDGVVTDIEMPKMNGFDLTASIRERPDTADLPVIIVTGLAKDEDKRRGLEVGANAYIVKSSFDQTALLDAVKSLVGA